LIHGFTNVLQEVRILRFEGFEVDPGQRLLTRAGQAVPLNARTLDVLLYLARHPQRLVTKEELLEAVWPGSFVEEGNLTQHIFLLRKALAAAGEPASLVVTVPGKGYQFTAPVESLLHTPTRETLVLLQDITEVTRVVVEETIEEEVHLAAPKLLAPRSASRRGIPLWSAAVVGALAVLLAIRVFAPATPHVASYEQITHDGNTKFMGGSDGNRIYFTEEVPDLIHEVSVTGGAIAPIDVPLQYVWAGDISPDGATMLVVSQAGGQGPGASLWSYQLMGGAMRQLANALSAAWMPDGKSIVYTTANGDIFRSLRDGSEAKKLISTGGYVKSLSCSPDGQMIRFSKDGLLWQMNTNGGNLHQLLPGWRKTATQWSGRWSQDGRFFFVSDEQIWMLKDRVLPGFHSAAPPVQLTSGPTAWDMPIPSRDGSKVYASGRTKRGQLVRLDHETHQLHPFLDGISAEFLSYSNDGKSIAYVTFPEGILWRARSDGSHSVQLTTPPVYPKSPRWSPDGSQIVFVDNTAQNASAIFVLPADGSGRPRRLLPDDRDAESDPCWSPDGSKIVFSTISAVGASSKSDLRILDLATKRVTVLPESDGLTVPRWSPDGSTIAAMTVDSLSLRVLALATQRWSVLNSGSVAFPEWSRDGRSIYFIDWHGDGSLARISVANNSKEKIADLKGEHFTGFYTSWMALDPEDTPLMLRDIGRDDIYALTLE
jgi:DNA-binding winged helix-turn-helix (wHTH) protein/Tol biopolymer transport system component